MQFSELKYVNSYKHKNITPFSETKNDILFGQK